jgi:hypothetical protein
MNEDLAAREAAVAEKAEQLEEVSESLADLCADLRGVLEEVRGRVEVDERELDDDRRERVREWFESERDVDLILHLLIAHRLVEIHASGKARYLAQAEAVAITTTLKRFAPEDFRDAVALWEETAVPVEEVMKYLENEGHA